MKAQKLSLLIAILLTACLFNSSTKVEGKVLSTSTSQIAETSAISTGTSPITETRVLSTSTSQIADTKTLSTSTSPILETKDLSTGSSQIQATTSDYIPLITKSATGVSQAIVVDHTSTDITKIPSGWIEAAKQKIVWIYVHTSYGSQLVTGAQYLSQYENSPLYNFLNHDGEAPISFSIPTQINPIALRMGNNSNWGYSAPDFTAMIRQHITSSNYGPNDIPVFMWSWCGQVAGMTPAEVQQYLDFMAWGESQYPQVTFVYMTDHTSSAYDQNAMNENNNMIRNYAKAHNKVLYDYNDIEIYQPDGTLPPGTPDGSCPWCQTWCDTHPGFCPNFSLMAECSHTHPLGCLLKSQALWWLSARLAGWNGQTQ